MAKDLKVMFGDMHGLDEKSVVSLTSALDAANLPGFDYLEFKQSLAALSQMNIDEMTAIKSAYATAATMGLTKSKLIETAQHYKSVLAGEMNKFQQALENRIQKKVEGKRSEVEKLKKQIIEYKAKIIQLEEQVAKHQNTIDTADSSISKETGKIESIRGNFERAHQSILNQIDKDILNINQYL